MCLNLFNTNIKEVTWLNAFNSKTIAFHDKFNFTNWFMIFDMWLLNGFATFISSYIPSRSIFQCDNKRSSNFKSFNTINKKGLWNVTASHKCLNMSKDMFKIIYPLAFKSRLSLPDRRRPLYAFKLVLSLHYF